MYVSFRQLNMTYTCDIDAVQKNDFVEESKILVRHTDLKIIMLAHQNNYVGNSSMMNNTAKSFDVLTSLSILHNYFVLKANLTSFFLDLFLI